MKISNRFIKESRGFTLIELLVVIAIIGLLGSIISTSLNSARAGSRDARRLADMRQIATAVELYYQDNGSYPLPANGSGAWTGHCPNYGNNDNYIVGLAPKYVSKIPIDPRYDTGSQCYLYRSDGKDFIIIAHFTMETICGNDPSNACNPPHIRQLDRPCCTQPTTAIYSSGARNW